MHRAALATLVLWTACGGAAARAPGHALSTGRLSYAAAVTDTAIVAAELGARFELIAYRRDSYDEIWTRDIGPADYDVNALAVGGQTIWLALDDGTVRGYRLDSGATLVAWHLGAKATAVAATADYVVTGSSDGVLCLRRSVDGALLQCVAAHRDEITDLAIRDDELASAGRDGRVIVWAIPSLAARRSTTLSGSANAVAFSPKGRLAIATSARPLVRTPEIARSEARGFAGVDRDSRVVIWERSGPVRSMAGHRAPVTDVLWLGEDELLSSSWDRTVIRWSSGGPQRVVAQFGNLVRGLAGSPALWVACAWSLSPSAPATWAVRALGN